MAEFTRDDITEDGFYEFRRVDRPASSVVLWVRVDHWRGPVVNRAALALFGSQVPILGLIGWEWSGPIDAELPDSWPDE